MSSGRGPHGPGLRSLWPPGRASRPGRAKLRTSGKSPRGPSALCVRVLGRFADGVFVGDQLLLEMSFGAARAGFACLPCSGLLLAASENAYDQGIAGLAGAGPPGHGPGQFRLAGVRFQDLAAAEGSARLALRWDAVGPDGGSFAALDANLTLARAAEQASLLALAGTYRLPATVLTAAPGSALAGLAGPAMIRAFLTRVAAGIVCPPANVT
jgi:hypothetical protein